MSYSVSEVRKTLVAVAAFAVTVLTTVLTIGPDKIPNDWLPWIHVGIALAGSYGVFAVKNVAPAGELSKPDESVADL